MKKEKKAKEIYEPKKGLTGQGDDYHIYTMNMKEKATAFLLGMAGTFIVIFLFFKSVVLGLVAGIAVGIFIQKYYAAFLCEKRKKTLLMQFHPVKIQMVLFLMLMVTWFRYMGKMRILSGN